MNPYGWSFAITSCSCSSVSPKRSRRGWGVDAGVKMWTPIPATGQHDLSAILFLQVGCQVKSIQRTKDIIKGRWQHELWLLHLPPDLFSSEKIDRLQSGGGFQGRQFCDDFCLRVHFTSVWNSQAIKQAQKARSYFVWKQQKNFSVGFCVAHSWLLYKIQCPIKPPSANHRSLSWHSQVCKLWCICLIAGKTAQTFHCIGDWLAQCPRWPDAIVKDSLLLLAGQRFRCALQPRACRWLMSHCVQAALYVTARHAQLFIKLIWLLLLELWSNYTLVGL